MVYKDVAYVERCLWNDPPITTPMAALLTGTVGRLKRNRNAASIRLYASSHVNTPCTAFSKLHRIQCHFSSRFSRFKFSGRVQRVRSTLQLEFCTAVVAMESILKEKGFESRIVDLFTTNDIDIAVFKTMTAADLTELGITSFGLRRKLQLLQVSQYSGVLNYGSLEQSVAR